MLLAERYHQRVIRQTGAGGAEGRQTLPAGQIVKTDGDCRRTAPLREGDAMRVGDDLIR